MTPLARSGSTWPVSISASHFSQENRLKIDSWKSKKNDYILERRPLFKILKSFFGYLKSISNYCSASDIRERFSTTIDSISSRARTSATLCNENNNMINVTAMILSYRV